jgi:hypothetical protein
VECTGDGVMPLGVGARQVGILAAATATAGTANAGNAAALVTRERRDRSDVMFCGRSRAGHGVLSEQSAEPDPIFAAIASYKFWDKASVELGDEETRPADHEATVDAAVAARWRLCETPPTTLAGPVALLNFAVEEQQHLQVPLPDDHPETMVFIESLAHKSRGWHWVALMVNVDPDEMKNCSFFRDSVSFL